MKVLMILLFSIVMTGCIFYQREREAKADADILEQQAAILTLYRHCLEQYQHNPPLAKSQCEHYTQALLSLDVRGLR